MSHAVPHRRVPSCRVPRRSYHPSQEGAQESSVRQVAAFPAMSRATRAAKALAVTVRAVAVRTGRPAAS